MTSEPGQGSEEPEPPLLDEFADSATPEILGQVASVALGAAIAGLPGALVGAVIGPSVPHFIKTLEERQRRAGESADRMLTWTSELTGMSPAELHAWAVHNDERLNLLAATVQAALASLDQAKLRALAQVLAEAVEDDAKLDISALMTQTLADLEPPHIRVLKAMCTEASPTASGSGEFVPAGVWLFSTLEERFPTLSGGLLPILATLQRHALLNGRGLAATRADGQPDPVWNATEYGKRVLSYLAASGAEVGATN